MKLIAYKGLIDKNHPGNSKSAILNALRHGFSHIEVDIRCTKDEKFVLMHDSTLSRECDFNSPLIIRKMNYAHIKNIKFKNSEEKIFCLDEILELVRNKCTLLLDIKDKLSPQQQLNLTTLIKDKKMQKSIMVYPNKKMFSQTLLPFPVGIPLQNENQLFSKGRKTFAMGMPHAWNKKMVTELHEARKKCLTTLKSSYVLKRYQHPHTSLIKKILSKILSYGIDFIIVDSAYFEIVKPFLNKDTFP